MANIWNFIQNVFNVVINVGQTIWELLTTPIINYINSWNLPGWLDNSIGEVFRWVFRGDITLLTLLPVFIGILLIVRIIMLFVK